VPSAPVALVTASAAADAATFSPTAAPPTATVAPTSVPATPEPTLAPTPAPTRAPTPTPPPGPIRNDGQRIIASLDTPLVWFFGEGGGSPATNVANYRLNGTSLAGSMMRCTKILTNASAACAALDFVPSIRLVNGQRYELALLDQVLGSFVVRGLVAATPHVVSVSATQFALTVKFDRPMLHAGDCGTYTWNLVTPGTIEHVRGTGAFPAAIGSYTTTNAGYGDFFTAFVSQADISDDCTTVKFGSGWGGVIGDVDITVSGVEDIDGNLVQPRTFNVTIADEGPPKLMFAQLELQTAEKKVIRVAYSEAMDEDYVTDPERYYLNGKAIPATTTIECELASCTWVRLTFAPSAFVYGSENTLTIIGVRDLAGNAMTPDIVTSGKFQVF